MLCVLKMAFAMYFYCKVINSFLSFFILIFKGLK
ncbi:Uncharacterised protein [Yersinia intermedia]|nr:Uncharacterised protein [Yersinia intermedia]